MKIIKVENLSKTFTTTQKEPGFRASLISLFKQKKITKYALKNVSFEIKEGEIVGLIGANGAGKTTLSKILSGIIHRSSGTVSVLGTDPWERKISFRKKMSLIMGQKASLWWDLPAYDCYLLLKEIYQIPEDQFHTRVEFLAKTLGISDQLKVQIRKLSLGERMKVELIAALLHNPQVIYLDEPTIGLDLTAQRAVRKFLLEYKKEFNPCMILTSHYMEDIEELCERIIILKEGEIVYDGPLKEILTKYADEKQIVLTLMNGDTLKEKVSRHLVGDRVSTLLKTNNVQDVSITEVEISDVIERIISKGMANA
jgi:ABC-2 type transport system ATP-binding protein